MLTSTQEQARALKDSGLSDQEIAESMGISLSQVTSLALQPIDQRYDNLESNLLGTLEELQSSGMLALKPLALVKTLVSINGIRRRGGPLGENKEVRTVTLFLPKAVANNVVRKNENNEIIGIGDTTFVTASAKTLGKLITDENFDTIEVDSFN